jgi:hypothetical protein
MSVIRPGARVDLYYYAESDHVRSVSGQVEDRSSTSVTIITTLGDLEEFPLTSIQRMILTEALEDRLSD